MSSLYLVSIWLMKVTYDSVIFNQDLVANATTSNPDGIVWSTTPEIRMGKNNRQNTIIWLEIMKII